MRFRELTKGFILLSISAIWVYSMMEHLNTLVN